MLESWSICVDSMAYKSILFQQATRCGKDKLYYTNFRSNTASSGQQWLKLTKKFGGYIVQRGQWRFDGRATAAAKDYWCDTPPRAGFEPGTSGF